MTPRVENPSQWGQHIVESLRARAVRYPDPQLDAFVTGPVGAKPVVTPGLPDVSKVQPPIKKPPNVVGGRPGDAPADVGPPATMMFEPSRGRIVRVTCRDLTNQERKSQDRSGATDPWAALG
jgi:hypothetical protein